MRDHRGVHREVEGFSKRAGEYERGRPDYPTEVVTWIVEQTGLGPGDVVVDLAAGTGKLTRRLVAAGARIVAVEQAIGLLLNSNILPIEQAHDHAAYVSVHHSVGQSERDARDRGRGVVSNAGQIAERIEVSREAAA